MTKPLPMQLEKLQQFADRPALTDGQQTLSYQQLAATIAELATWLQQFSAQRFAINGPNSLSWIIADLALALSDKICVPVPRFFSADQQAYILETAGIEVILDTEARSDNISAPLTGLWYRLRVPTNEHSLAQFPMQSGKVTFTSGTTGKPKGVCLS